MGDNYYGEVVEASRVVSEDAAHYILIKGLTRKQQMAEAERCKARRLLNEKKESERQSKSKEPGLDMEDVKPVQDDLVDERGDSDMEVKVTGQGKSNRRILSDDEEMMDEEQVKKTRREIRGKSLVTKRGLRSVAKKGKGRQTSSPENTQTGDIPPDQVKANHDAEVVVKREDKSPLEMMTDDEVSPVVDVSVHEELQSSHVPKVTEVKTEPVDVLSDPQLTSGGLGSAEDGASCKAENVIDLTSDCNTADSTDSLNKEESDIAETRDRLLTEEEELISAKEAKMAALLKSLEKRTQALESSSQGSDSNESQQKDVQASLLQQEEQLLKEKEAKMAALLKAVEKRSADLQSRPDPEPASSETDKDREENKLTKASRTRKSEQVPAGFLEDVAELEQKAVQRSNRNRQSRQQSSAQLDSSSSLVKHSSSTKHASAPSLTLDYLEDVESMLELGKEEKHSKTDQNTSGTETEAKATSEQNVSKLPAASLDDTSRQRNKNVSSSMHRSASKHKSEGGKNCSPEEVELSSVHASPKAYVESQKKTQEGERTSMQLARSPQPQEEESEGRTESTHLNLYLC